MFVLAIFSSYTGEKALATIGPAVSAEVRNLIRQIVCCRDFLKLYRLEGSRDDGELLKTGIEVSQATVAK